MEFYILDLKETKFDLSQRFPSEAVIRTYLESQGIECGTINVKPNGNVFIYASPSPLDPWREFDGSAGVNQGLQLAVHIDKMRQYVKLYDQGSKPDEKRMADTLYHLCSAALITMGIPVDND